jgi:ABC-type uncharacterized transport system substrate-binding protein
MRRREFASAVAAVAVACPWVARAQQQAALPVVGFLNGASSWEYANLASAFGQGLSETGYIERTNVLLEYRWADGRYERLPALAADLIGRRVNVLAAFWPATLAAKAATTTIPIVFVTGGDPVALGLVASLNRPGGNLTGATSLTVEVGPKRLELLRELLPTVRAVGFLVNPTNPFTETLARETQVAANIFGIELLVLQASTERDFDPAFATLRQRQVAALVIGSDAFFNTRSELLAQLALRHAIPTIYQYREFTGAGGLMSYGGSLADACRIAGVYAGRILKGEKPADLPVQQSTRIELIINTKTAKTLGLTFPLTLLGRADEVIE